MSPEARRPRGLPPVIAFPLPGDLIQPNGREHFLMQRELEFPSYRSQRWIEKQKTNNLKEGLLAIVEPEERPFLEKVIRFANKIHKGQVREDGKTPHINHVLRVAYRTAALRQVMQDSGENIQVSIEEIAVAVLHDTAEDFQPKEKNREKAHDLFAKEFIGTFHDYPKCMDVYTGIQAFNKFDLHGKKKEDEEYYPQLAKNGLLRIKAIDRIDSLIGDISKTLTEGVTDERVKRIGKSRRKTEKIFPLLEETQPEILPQVKPVVIYARTFEATHAA